MNELSSGADGPLKIDLPSSAKNKRNCLPPPPALTGCEKPQEIRASIYPCAADCTSLALK